MQLRRRSSAQCPCMHRREALKQDGAAGKCVKMRNCNYCLDSKRKRQGAKFQREVIGEARAIRTIDVIVETLLTTCRRKVIDEDLLFILPSRKPKRIRTSSASKIVRRFDDSEVLCLLSSSPFLWSFADPSVYTSSFSGVLKAEKDGPKGVKCIEYGRNHHQKADGYWKAPWE